MNLILQDVSRFVELDPSEQEIFLSYFESKSYKAKTVLLNKGEVCKSLYFVNKGVIRNYFTNSDNIEYVFRIADEGKWISSIKSFHNQSASENYIEVIENAEVMELSYANYALITGSLPKTETYFRKLITSLLIEISDRTKDILALSAEDIYLRFKEKNPSLINRIAQKHIASFIGVTSAFFSRMKPKLLKKHK